jgi:hypothetical protein
MGSGFGPLSLVSLVPIPQKWIPGLQPLGREGPVLPRSAHRGKHRPRRCRPKQDAEPREVGCRPWMQFPDRLTLFRWKFARFLFRQKLQNDFALGLGCAGIGEPLPEQGHVFEMDISVHVVPPWLDRESDSATKRRREHSRVRQVLREIKHMINLWVSPRLDPKGRR